MYSILNRLCTERGITLAALSRETGIPKSVFSELKSGRTKTLSAKNIAKVANYFGVSASVLWGEDEKIPTEGEDIKGYLEMLRERPETRMLLEYSKGISRKEIEAVAEMMRRLRSDD